MAHFSRPVSLLLLGCVGALVRFALVVLITIFTGAYNVAASVPHTGLGNWILETNMKNSVAARAADIEAPTRFTVANVMAGAEHSQSMFEQCHRGPGTQGAGFARGLRPRPPGMGNGGRPARNPV